MRKAILLFLLVLSTGCGVLFLKTPEVQVQSARIDKLTFKGIQFELVVTIFNPNRISVTVTGYHYQLYLNDVHFARGKSLESVKIEARKTRTVSIPVTIAYSQLLKGLNLATKADSLQYRIEGVLSVKLPLRGEHTIPVKSSGKLDLPGLRKFLKFD